GRGVDLSSLVRRFQACYDDLSLAQALPISLRSGVTASSLRPRLRSRLSDRVRFRCIPLGSAISLVSVPERALHQPYAPGGRARLGGRCHGAAISPTLETGKPHQVARTKPQLRPDYWCA